MLEYPMESIKALNIVMWLSIAGMLFSGYLSFTELTANTCAIGGCSALAGIPTCVYGFAMYLAIFIICIIGNDKIMLWIGYTFKMHKFYK